jgi:hypothetical protein
LGGGGGGAFFFPNFWGPPIPQKTLGNCFAFSAFYAVK